MKKPPGVQVKQLNKREALAQVCCFLLDMDGTIYLGEQLLKGSIQFIEYLQHQGCDYLFLTNNSSKDSQQYAEKFARLGMSVPREKIMTSGEATAMHVARQKPGARVYVVGTALLENEFRHRGMDVTDELPEFTILGFDTTMTYDKMWKLCDLVRAGTPYIATHPDYNCPTETGFMPDIGAMIAFVKASTGREPDLIVGKPNSLLAEYAAERTGVPVSKMCMIGDRLYTDIAVGAAADIPTILVLSGETQSHEVAASPFQPTYIFQNMQAVREYLIHINSTS
jgi:HAD superfamily hydrolase (TIGR01457 family)